MLVKNLKVLVLGAIIVVSITHIPHVVAQGRLAITFENAAQLKEITSIKTSAKFVDFAIAPDGLSIAITDSNALRLFDLPTGEEAQILLKEKVSDPVFSKDGTLIAAHSLSCSSLPCSGKIFVIEAASGDQHVALDLIGLIGAPITFSSDGSQFAYTVSDIASTTQSGIRGVTVGPSVIHIVSSATGEEVATVKEPLAVLGGIFFSPDGSQIAFSTYEWTKPITDPNQATLRIVDISTGKDHLSLATSGQVLAVDPTWQFGFVSPFNALDGMVGARSSPRIIELKTAKTVFTLAKSEVWTVGFSADATLAVVAGGTLRGVVSIRDLSDPNKPFNLEVKEATNIYNPTFSSDRTLLAFSYVAKDDTMTYLSVWGLSELEK